MYTYNIINEFITVLMLLTIHLVFLTWESGVYINIHLCLLMIRQGVLHKWYLFTNITSASLLFGI